MSQSTYIRDGFVSAGNAQITGSLGVTGGITGSLQGTASYATQALSASYAPGGGSGTVNSGVAGYVAYYPTTTTTVDDTNGLYWDQTNSRLGIGTASPSFPISLGASLGNKIGIYDVGGGSGYGFGIQSSLFQVFSYLSSDDISSLTDQWIEEVTVNNDPDAVKFSVTNHHNPYRNLCDFDRKF